MIKKILSYERIEKNLKLLEENLDMVEKKIKRFSQKSKLAPSEFLDSELKRFMNIWALRWPEYRNDDLFNYFLKEAEDDYLCYFETKKYKKTLDPTAWWITYAGSNSQIERFLIKNNLAEALQKLGFSEPFKLVNKIAKNDLPETILKYLIGLCYLYPSSKKNLIIHPNMLMAQRRRILYSADSPFLSRDLIRCPYHFVSDPYHPIKLSDKEIWKYGCDLIALTLGSLPPYIHYRPEHFKDASSIENENILDHLRVGKRLIPKRYTTLEAEMEKFEWYIPKD